MEHLSPMIDRAFSRQAMHTEDLPELDLYMDQVITLIENGYAAQKRTPDEKLLTKTMVQNYSKAGLVRPIKGKKYTPEHIVQMLVIYSLKRTLTLSEIKQALDVLYAQRGFDDQALCDCYEQSLADKAILSQQIANLLKAHEAQGKIQDQAQSQISASVLPLGQTPRKPGGDPAQYFAALLTAATLSEAFAGLAESILDEFFPAAEPKKPEKKK